MTLYELTSEWQTVLDMAEDGEIDEQTMADTLESIGGDIEDKADGYAMVIRQLKADAEACKVEEQRLKERKQRLWDSVDRIQKHLEDAMKFTGKTKFKTARFSFGIQKNPASVVIDHPELVPKAYLIEQEPKIDKVGIKNLLNEGDAIACHFAHLEQTTGLRIR